jgi:hypothetical protein
MITKFSKNGTKGKRRCPSCNSEQVVPIVYGRNAWRMNPVKSLAYFEEHLEHSERYEGR